MFNGYFVDIGRNITESIGRNNVNHLDYMTHINQLNSFFFRPIKVTTSMARSLPVENLLQQNAGSIINSCRNSSSCQWGTHRCNRPQPATDNDVRDGRSN